MRQTAYLVQRAHKSAALGRILDVEAPTAAIVFCRTRAEVDGLTDTLNGRGYRAEALHGGLTQDQRDKVMGRLRAGSSELLVATDVAARGLDIDQLTHVVNFDVPAAPEAYVHRIGRVGRAGREGVAITLAEPREHRQLKTIERLTKQKIPIEKVPTVADLHARRLEATRAALHESLLEDDLTRFRVVVETLADEFDLMEVALAAVKLAHEARGGRRARRAGHPRDRARARNGRARPSRRPYKGKGAGRAASPAAGRRARSPASSSAPGARRASARRISSAPSPASRASAARTSARSRSPTGSRSSSSPPTRPTRSSRRCAAARSRARRRRCGARSSRRRPPGAVVRRGTCP